MRRSLTQTAVALALVGAALTGCRHPAEPAGGAAPLPERAWLAFGSADCEECEWLKREFLPGLRAALGAKAPPVFLVDLDATGGYELLVEAETLLGRSGDKFPALLVGRRLHYGKTAIAAAREEILQTGAHATLPTGLAVRDRSLNAVAPLLAPPAQPDR